MLYLPQFKVNIIFTCAIT